jgi:prepilin-type N-terminal cleavage/methylation domain-containing protein
MLTKKRNKRSGTRDANQGFSFVEMLVAIALAAILVLVIYSVFTAYQRTVMYQEDLVEIQQAGRNALSTIRDDLLLVGRGVEDEKGQEMILYAAPWEFVFNGDVTERGQLAVGETFSFGGPDSPYTGAEFLSDAETVRYYMDVADDAATEKDYSHSQHDRILRRKINNAFNEVVGYGIRYDNGVAGGYNGAVASEPPQQRVIPLFQFWGDFDFNPSTADTLWGDSNGNGILGDLEISSLYTGGFSFSYDGPSGAVTVTPPLGAIYLIASTSNNEDLDGDGELDTNEDTNNNGRLDNNVLDSVLHRVELNITTIAQNPDLQYDHPRDSNYHFRETWVHTAVDPRNLVRTDNRDCGGPPAAPATVNATTDLCGGIIHVAWTRSADDGGGENDVLWYEVQRRPGANQDWEAMAVVPATGVAIYGVDDVDPAIGLAHVYRVFAVDCGDSRSAASGASNAVTPVVGAPGPPTNVSAFDSPCYNDNTFGSITVTWQASTDPSITEYWVYRSEPEELVAVGSYPVAKLKATGSTANGGPNTVCGGSGSDPFQSHVSCLTPTRYDYYKVANMFVWRDELGSTGRTAGSGTPLPGSQWDIGIDAQRYHYVVRGYDGDPNSSNYECLSNPAHLISECGDHMEVQSFDNSFSGGGGSTSRSLFTPPLYLDVQDVSEIGWNGQIENARMRVRWNASLDQWCSSGEIPDYYYVYRNKLWGLHLINQTTEEFNFDSQEVIVYRAAQIVSTGTQDYQFYDDNDLYAGDTAHTAGYLNTGTQDLRPDGGWNVDAGGKLYESPWPVTGEGTPQYDYIVAAANTNSTWGFGASCVFPAGYECFSECPGTIDEGASYAEQHSMRGDEESATDGDDEIRVYWTFDDAPPTGARIDLHGRIFPGGDWEEVYNDVPSASGNPGSRNWLTGVEYLGTHSYADQADGRGRLYEYSIVITCPETGSTNDEGCERRVLLNAEIGASVPGVPLWCMSPAPSTDPNPCPADAGRFCTDTAMGRVVFYVTDQIVSPSDERSQTDKRYMYFRIARWEKFHADATYAVEPQTEYMLRTPGIPNAGNNQAPNGMLCPNNASYCYDPNPPYYPGAPLGYQPRFDVFEGSFTENRTSAPTTVFRRFRFEEYLDPNYDYKYTVETRIGHTADPPRDCCHADVGGSGPCLTTCNGTPAEAIYVEFATNAPCYPYEYAGYCCGPVTDYEKDPFTGLGGGIGVRNAVPPSTGARTPWDNDMWPQSATTFYIAIDLPIIGTVVIFNWDFMYLGPYYYKFYNNEIFTDMNSFFDDWMWPFNQAIHIDLGFLGTFHLPLLWSGPIDRAMCEQCLISIGLPWPIGQVDILCARDFWSDCTNDVYGLFNHTLLLDNFASGNCGATAGNASVDGDMMMHWHWRSQGAARQLGAVFRMAYTATAPQSTEGWYLLQDHSPNNQVNYSVGYQYRGLCERELTTTQGVSNNSYDTQWWANLALVCTKRGGNNTTGEGQMYVFWWADPDPSKGKDLQTDIYRDAPRLAWHTIGATFSGAPYYNNSPPPNPIGKHTGLVGFWTDPYIDWTVDAYFIDNVRIIPYCGACPPEGLEQYLPSPYKKEGSDQKFSLCAAEFGRAVSKKDVPRKGVAAAMEKSEKSTKGSHVRFRSVSRSQEEYDRRNEESGRKVIREQRIVTPPKSKAADLYDPD